MTHTTFIVLTTILALALIGMGIVQTYAGIHF